MRRTLFLFLLLLITLTAANAQVLKPVKWAWKATQVAESTFELVFEASIDDGWYVYSQYIEEGGPNPTAFEYDEPEGLELVGKNVEQSEHTKEGQDEMFEMFVRKFEESVTFTQRVKVPVGSERIVGYLTYQACDDARCLRPTDVDFDIPLSYDAALQDAAPSGNEEATPPPPITIPADQKPTRSTTTTTSERKTDGTTITTTTTTTSSGGTFAGDAVPDLGIESPEPTTESESEPTPTPSAGQENVQKPVTWELSSRKNAKGNIVLTAKANVIDGWYIYSANLDPDIGPVPTAIEVEEGGAPAGKHTETSDYRIDGYDDIFEAEVVKFKKEVTFERTFNPIDGAAQLTGYIDFMSCNDATCIKPLPEEFAIDVATGALATNTVTGQQDGFAFKRDVKTAYLTGCVTEEVKESSFWRIFILGFIGGFAALLTPCVFPMIPLTVSFFTKSSKTRAQGVANASIYGASIVFIYVLLGTGFTIAFGADFLNALSTHWLPNTLFFLIFVVFAASFFGYFEITLPSSWANNSDRAADRGGLIGIFFMAFTLALVSFSCTGPLIGSLLVESISGVGPTLDQYTGIAALEPVKMRPLMGMFGFGLALALPFTLFAIFPGWLNSLPRSGGWMNAVKVTLGFLELALALKFLSVADMTEGWDVLRYEPFIILWASIFAGLGLYHLNVISFPHDSPKRSRSVGKFAFGGLSFLFVGYLLFHLFTYTSPTVLSGIAPPVRYNFFRSDSAGDLKYYKDFDEAMEVAIAENKPLFVDFTGYGCVNCRKMEENVWPTDRIDPYLRDSMIIVSLYVDDREKLPEPILWNNTAENTTEKIRRIGGKWATFQIENFRSNTQPLYVVLAPNSDELVQLNEPVGYTPEVDDYESFMECGMNNFNAYARKNGLNLIGEARD